MDAFRAADNPIDEQLVVDLEEMVTRTRSEVERLSLHLAGRAVDGAKTEMTTLEARPLSSDGQTPTQLGS